ncbi:MAG: DUF1598 domain-containing protein [Planctomycetota bacterium]|nr:MAG: DUF1598 domain-containing protein [Planctomycetota bacterium]
MAACSVSFENATAQFGNVFGNRGVGGVMIDADGVLRNSTAEDQSRNLEQLRSTMQGAQGDLAKATDLRLISLKGIQQMVLEAQKQGKSIPEDVYCLGGLTRIDYVFVYPERNDIVIAGPAEPWAIGPQGSIVGKNTGSPVVNLDDLATAFRYVDQARNGGVSVSIDPTEQGYRQFNQALRNLGGNVNPSQAAPALARAFGPQQVTLSGLPADSHMARVILAADYRMKLYGMNLAKPPVAGLPSYMEMIQNRSNASTQIQSRWWMACDYDAITHSKDRLAWKISGQRIKTMTETEAFDQQGQRKQTGKADPVAKKWADNFTKKIGELAVKDPVFGELRNVMDLCLVAALIESQNLQSLAACDLSSILGNRGQIETIKLDVAKSLDPQISFLQTAQGLLVSASGGVMIESWYFATQIKENESVGEAKVATAKLDNDKIWYQ